MVAGGAQWHSILTQTRSELRWRFHVPTAVIGKGSMASSWLRRLGRKVWRRMMGDDEQGKENEGPLYVAGDSVG